MLPTSSETRTREEPTWWGTQFPDQSAEDIEGILADFMGLHTYVRMENLPFDGIHHIDMHMKLLDEETILMAEYPAGVADGPQIEANLEYVLWPTTPASGAPPSTWCASRLRQSPDGAAATPTARRATT